MVVIWSSICNWRSTGARVIIYIVFSKFFPAIYSFGGDAVERTFPNLASSCSSASVESEVFATTVEEKTVFQFDTSGTFGFCKEKTGRPSFLGGHQTQAATDPSYVKEDAAMVRIYEMESMVSNRIPSSRKGGEFGPKTKETQETRQRKKV